LIGQSVTTINTDTGLEKQIVFKWFSIDRL